MRVLVRSEEAAARVRAAAPGVEVVSGDVADAARGCGLVYHLAGTYRGSPDELRAMHVDGTAALLAAVDPDARVVLLELHLGLRVGPVMAGRPRHPAGPVVGLRAGQAGGGGAGGGPVRLR